MVGTPGSEDSSSMSDKLIVKKLAATNDGVAVMQLSGPLQLNTLFELQTMVREGASNALIIDMTSVPIVDSAGIGLLVNAHVSRSNSGRKFALVGVAERIKTILTVTGVYNIFSVFPTLEAAQGALRQPASS